jgi:dihydroorotate dehydrogenase (fumarate)
MNAAGTCKSIEDVRRLAPAAVSAIVVGSGTILERTGNSGQVYQKDPANRFSLNSLGLPNPGQGYYKENLPQMVEIAHYRGRVLIFSVAGFSELDYVHLACAGYKAGVDLVELNLGCPNVWGKEGQKPIASFNSELTAEIIARCSDTTGKKFAVKLSPYSDPTMLERVAEIIARSRAVAVVTTTNTFPNAFGFDGKGKPLIQFTGQSEGSLAGLGGPAMKPIGLGQVKQFRKLLPDSIQIIGVGGINCGRDIWEYGQAGADAVQVATAYIRDGKHDEGVFERILREYYEIPEMQITPAEPDDI